MNARSASPPAPDVVKACFRRFDEGGKGAIRPQTSTMSAGTEQVPSQVPSLHTRPLFDFASSYSSFPLLPNVLVSPDCPTPTSHTYPTCLHRPSGPLECPPQCLSPTRTPTRPTP